MDPSAGADVSFPIFAEDEEDEERGNVHLYFVYEIVMVQSPYLHY